MIPTRINTRFATSDSTQRTGGSAGGSAAAGGSVAATTTTADSMAASLFKNPIVHQLWTARQQAKEQMKKRLLL
jgi:hypothetical protein